MSKKGFAPIAILLVAVGVFILGAVAYFIRANKLVTPVIPATSNNTIPVVTSTNYEIMEMETSVNKKTGFMNPFMIGSLVEIYGNNLHNLPPNPKVILTPISGDTSKVITITAKNDGVTKEFTNIIPPLKRDVITFVIPDEVQGGNYCSASIISYQLTFSAPGITTGPGNSNYLNIVPKIVFTPAVATPGSEVTITSFNSNIEAITSIDGNFLFINDKNCKTWKVNFSGAKFYEQATVFVSTPPPPTPYNFGNLIKEWKADQALLASGKEGGSGAPLNLSITGVVDDAGVVNATKIVRHVQ